MPAARLRRSADIANVRAAGRSLRRAAFAARVLRTEGPGVRMTVTASRTLGGAVPRNRAKRRVREAFRTAMMGRREALGLDLIVTARPEALTARFGALRDDAASLLEEAAR